MTQTTRSGKYKRDYAARILRSSPWSSGPGAYAPDAPQPIGLLCDPCPPVIFRCPHFRHQVPPPPYDVRDPRRERWNCGRECWPVILPKYRLPFRDLLHAANLRHGTDGSTSPLKEGVLRIFSP
jgi:hypothetical protein